MSQTRVIPLRFAEHPALSGIVDASARQYGSVAASVIFPRAEATLVPRPLGHVGGCALLRLTDGTIWTLRMPGRAWTRNRILSAAGVLAEVSASTGSDAEQRIRRLPGLEGVALEAPLLDAPDPLQWDLHRTAAALVARSRAATVPVAPDHQRARSIFFSLDAALMRELATALQGFVADLDAEVLEAASPAGSLEPALYNYLVREPFRTFRLQFAATFPAWFAPRPWRYPAHSARS